MKNSLINLTVLAVLATSSGAALAGSVTIPNDFSSGTPAVAAEVNENFSAVKTAVDDNDGRITTNAEDIAANETAIATKADVSAVTANTTTIATKADTSAVSANATSIAVNTTGIATNATTIAGKADASAVTANVAGIATNATSISTNASDIATNATGIATNVTAIATNATAIAGKADASAVTTNTADIATNTADIATNTADIATNTADIATNTADIATNTADIATNTADIATNATDIGTNATDIAALQAASTCPSDMVASGTLCVDKYEASVWDAATGGTQISGAGNAIYNACSDTGDAGSAGNGVATDCTNIYARSVTGVKPAYDITQYQAAMACANVGKRLPTISEWLIAAVGTASGNGSAAADCHNPLGGAAAVRDTGEPANCVSAAGAYDMVGNVWELTSDILLEGSLAIGTANTVNDMMAVALGSDYLALGSTESTVDTFFIVPDDFGNFSLGFRCVQDL